MNTKKYRDKILAGTVYFLIFWLPLQNTLLAFLVTNTSIPVLWLRPIHFFKEFLVLGTFIAALIFYGGALKYSKTAKVIVGFGFVVAFYSLITLAFSDVSLFQYSFLRQTKKFIFPFLIVLNAYLIPVSLKKIVHYILIATLIVCALGLFEVLFLPNQFYKNYLNVAELREKVKGMPEPSYSSKLGIGTNQRPRKAFKEIFPRRASSLYLTPLAFGHAMIPGLLFLFVRSQKSQTLFNIYSCFFLIAFAGWLLAFTRSSWLTLFVSFMTLSFMLINRYKKYLLLIFVLLLLSLFLPSVQKLIYVAYTSTFYHGGHHFQMARFYTSYLWEPQNVLGTGILSKLRADPIRRVAPDAGYFDIYKQLGLPGLFFFLMIHYALAKEFLSVKSKYPNLVGIGVGLIVANIVATNFSGYIFGGTFYYNILVFWGALLGASVAFTRVRSSATNYYRRNF